MNICKRIQTTLALLACIGFIVPSTIIAAPPAPSTKTTTADIALDAGGLLTGKVVDQAGQAVPNATLVFKTGQHQLVETLADDNGAFRIKSLQGGVYQMTADGFASTARLWTAQTAPPHAKKTATLVTGTIVRGQSCTNDSCTGTCDDCCGGCGMAGGSAPLAFLMNPIVIGAAVAAAVAIPLAIENNNDDDDNAS